MGIRAFSRDGSASGLFEVADDVGDNVRRAGLFCEAEVVRGEHVAVQAKSKFHALHLTAEAHRTQSGA